MYAKDHEELENALEKILDQQEETPFIQRFKAFYELRKDEWVFLFRKNLITRNHNTNNYSEVTIRILKDIVLSRTKAFNTVALVDFCVTSWEKYFQKRILDHAFSRNAKDIVHFRNLCSRMENISAQDIQQESEHTFSVPSENRSERYIVDTMVGICTCAFGSQGAFCKHMAILVQKHNIPMPNSPAVTHTERYKLGQLALGTNCPNISFFYDYKNLPANSATASFHSLPSTSATADSATANFHSLPSTSATADLNNLGTAHMIEHEEEDLQEMEEVNELARKIDGEWMRIKSILDVTNIMSLKKAYFCLSKVTNNALFDRMCLNMASSLGRKGGKIKVQPTAISRRKGVNITKGSRRIPAGRPPTNGPKRRLKRPRSLAMNIASNVPNAISHGSGH